MGKLVSVPTSFSIREVILEKNLLHVVKCGMLSSYSTSSFTQERPYRVSECRQALSQSPQLMQQRRTHTGERLHKRVQCGKAFSRSLGLIQHQRLHTREEHHVYNVYGKSSAKLKPFPPSQGLHWRSPVCRVHWAFSQRQFLFSIEELTLGETPSKP